MESKQDCFIKNMYQIQSKTSVWGMCLGGVREEGDPSSSLDYMWQVQSLVCMNTES